MIYLNGLLFDTFSIRNAAMPGDSQGNFIGGDADNPLIVFNGRIYGFLHYYGVLNANEILEVHEGMSKYYNI